MDTSLNVCTNTNVQTILRCALCEEFLSVPPIYQQEVGSVCGGCHSAVDKIKVVQSKLRALNESLTQLRIFPCLNLRYGCTAQLRWGELKEHDDSCLYKKLDCPFSKHGMFQNARCTWTGSGPSLNEHIENQHDDQIQILPEIHFEKMQSSCIYLTRLAKQLMIATIKRVTLDTFSCVVMVNGTSTDCDGYRYQMEFTDENRKKSVILKRNRLEDVVAFDQNLTNSEKAIIVEMPVMRSLLKNPEVVIGRFKIIKKSKCDRANERNANPSDCVDEDLLKELECPVCKKYMVPPIMICSRGHSFCGQCKEQTDDCPTCRGPFQEGRNYTLEKLTTCINYPCVNRKAGCLVVGRSERMKEHEQECPFAGDQCFLNCSSRRVFNMFKHLNEKHSGRLLTAGEVAVLDLSGEDEVTKYFAICFGNDMFRVVVSYDGYLKFSVQQFGVERSDYQFSVELTIADSSETIIFRTECCALSEDLWEKLVVLTDDMAKPFISVDGQLFFKIDLMMIS